VGEGGRRPELEMPYGRHWLLLPLRGNVIQRTVPMALIAFAGSWLFLRIEYPIGVTTEVILTLSYRGWHASPGSVIVISHEKIKYTTCLTSAKQKVVRRLAFDSWEIILMVGVEQGCSP
jgi:hypothetical protein